MLTEPLSERCRDEAAVMDAHDLPVARDLFHEAASAIERIEAVVSQHLMGGKPNPECETCVVLMPLIGSAKAYLAKQDRE